MFDRLKYLELSRDFRSTFQYNNIMFMVAGLLVEEVSGMTWEDFVKQRIFDVVDMPRTNTSTSATQKDANHSQPYMYRYNQLKEIPFLKLTRTRLLGRQGQSCRASARNGALVGGSHQWRQNW